MMRMIFEVIYFIADTHFGHHNIIKYEDRPFDNVYQMDKFMIKKWNSVVEGKDIVYHLGDFSLCNTRRAFYIFNRLKGIKYLIRGNHDSYSDTKFVKRMGFKGVYRRYWLGNTGRILLSHEPLEVNKNILNIHGHIHGLFYENSKWKDKNHRCVSVELINYTPISFMNILKVR